MKQSMQRMLAWTLATVLTFTCVDSAGVASALAEVVLPGSLTRIEDEAFLGDSGITGLVEVPDRVTYVGESAFEQSGVYALTFPESVAQIGADALAGTDASYAIIRNESAQIADGAFTGLSYLFGDAGSTAQTYADAAGISFVALDSLVLEGGFYYEVGERAALLCAQDATRVSGELVIPETVGGKRVTQIRARAFAGCGALTKLTVPYGVTVEAGTYDSLPNTEIVQQEPALEIARISCTVSGNVYAGKTPMWAVRAQGGEGVVRYRFELMHGGELIAQQDYAAKNYFSCTLNEPGSYVVNVSCLDEAQNICTASSDTIRVLAEPLQIVGVTGSVQSAVVGDEISWTVATQYGSEPVQYGFTVLCDGIAVATQDFADSAVCTYVPSKAGYYFVEATCMDGDATIVQQQSDIITVLSEEEARPAAPTLIFEDSALAFAADEASAPTYGVQSITTSWEAVENAEFYCVTLDQYTDGEWVNVLAQEGFGTCSVHLDASLFSAVTERTLYRFGICSQGVRTGEMRYSYFAVEKVEIDESILVEGVTSLTWEQAHCYSSTRDLTVTSQLPWTAVTTAEWLECIENDDGTLRVVMSAQEQIAEREATITISNGVNTATVSVYQGTAQYPPKLLLPELSVDASNPTSMPTGGFKLTWDNSEYGRTRLRVYEVRSNGTLRKIYGVYTSRNYLYMTEANIGEALTAGSSYMIELKGFYSSACQTNEVDAHALYQRYYLTMTADGHYVLVNGQSAVTMTDVTYESVYVTASNFFTCESDADWLTAESVSSSLTASAVQLSAEENNTESARTGHVTFTCGTAQAVVTVRQESMLPQILKPAGLSQNESSPTTLYANLNLLEDPIKFFLFRGDMLTIAKGSAGSYGEETTVESYSTFGMHDAWLETGGLINGAQYRLTVTNGDLSRVYYVKFSDNDGEPYDDIAIDKKISVKKRIGTAKQSMTTALSAQTSWKATSDSSWLTVSKSSGSSGDYTITITAAANTTGTARTGIVTFASTSTECEAWFVVEQSAQDYMEVCYNGDAGYEPYASDKHCTMLAGEAGKSAAFVVYSSLDYKVTSNASWMTLSSSGATSITNENGTKFYIYMDQNDTGAARTGTATITCGSITRTVSVTQAPAIGELVLISPQLSTDSGNPSIIQYEDTVITWKPVSNAVKYRIDTSEYRGIDQIIYADGSAQYSFTVPKSWLGAYSDSNQRLYIYAYDSYGHMIRYMYYFRVVTGDAALVNGEAEPEWLNADDVATSEDFVIQASQDWTAKASASWMTLSTTSGASGDTLTVSLSENTGAARTGQVTITVGSASTTIDISQCAYLANEYPTLISPALSSEKASPTLIAGSDSLTLTWEDEPQAWHYSLDLCQYTGATSGKIIAKTGTLRDAGGSYTFTGLELTEGELYSVMLRRYSARYGYSSAIYYMTISPENAWVLVEELSSYDEEFDGGEEHDYLTITASGYWNATTQDEWIMLSSKPIHQADLDENGLSASYYDSYGNLSGKNLCISVLANTDSQPRTGTVTVTSGNAAATIFIKQYQAYQIALITSPALSTTSSEMPRLPYGSVALRWSRAEGGTGNYRITLYESESQRTGYYKIDEKTGITSLSYTIPASEFTEGLYYRVRLDTELAADDYYGESYFFQMGYEDELTATVSIAAGEATVGKHLGVTVKASGGAGGYKYAYQLLKDGVVVQETAYETMSYYSFAPTEEGTYSIRVYVKDASGTVVILDSRSFNAENETDTLNLSRSVWAAGVNAESIDVTVDASTAWTATPSDSWISVAASGNTATVSVVKNTNTASRSGSVAFTAGSASATLSIAQEAQTSAEDATITLSPSVWNITDVTSAAAANLTITCDGAWTASNVPDWISLSAVSGTGTTTIQVYAAANQSAARSAQISFTCGGQSTGWLVTQSGNELAPRVTAVSVTDSAPKTGEEVTFAIASSNADTLIFTVDGTPYEKIYVTGDTTTFTRAFSRGGVREVTFVPMRGNVIGTASDAVTMNVVSYGTLAAPVLTCDTETELGESVTVSWNAIDHADQYVIYVERDGIVLVKESAWTQEEYELTYDVLSCAGTYIVQVMPVGAGYSQSESAEIITVTVPETTAKLSAPRAGATYDIGNTLGMQADNPEGRPMTMQLYYDGQLIATFPENGTISALAPYYEYTLTQAGTYQANLTVYGAAGNVIASTSRVSFTVSGPTIEKSGTYIGTGTRGMYADQATSFRVVTNTAVSTVTLTEGEKSYTVTGGGTLDTSNWTRVFTGTMDVPAEGKHVVTVTAADDYGHTATKDLTYYAVTRDNSGTTVYPQSKCVSLKSAPDAATVSASLYPSDTATLLGTCGDYRYVSFGGMKGFVHKDDIGTTRLTTWEGLSVAVPMLISGDIPGCILSNGSFNIFWTSSVMLPASAQYRMSLVDENGTVTQKYQGSYGSFKVPMNTLKAGKYTVRIEVVSADNAVTYLVLDSLHQLDMKETYTDFFLAMDAQVYNEDLSKLFGNHWLFMNLYRFFSKDGYYDADSGEIVKADLESVTKNAVFTAYQAYFGDTLTAIGERELVRASIAEAIMDDDASKRATVPEMSLGSFKKFLKFFGVENEVISDICAADFLGQAGILNDYNPYTTMNFYDDLTKKYSLDSAGIMKGVSTGVKVGELLASVWSKYVKYSCVDHEEIDKIISQLKATGNEHLIGVADYLTVLNDEDSLLAFLIIGYGGKAVADYFIDECKKIVEGGVAKLIARLPGGFEFTIGAAIGKEIGLAINKNVFNVDNIQNTACELQWRIDAAGIYYHTYVDAYCAFLEDPVAGYANYVETTVTFGQMISIIYQGWADFMKAYDDAGWNRFVRFWTRKAGLSEKAQYQADTLPALALNNLGTCIDYFYYHFLATQNVHHIAIPGVYVEPDYLNE